MESGHHLLSDEQFLSEFENAELPIEWFNHEAHIRMAWIYLNQKDITNALTHIAKGIRKLDIIYADGMKYHHTITIAFSLILYYLMQKHSYKGWKEFLSAHPELRSSKKLLSIYYSDEILNGTKARKTFVVPDKKSLPIELNVEQVKGLAPIPFIS